MDLKSSVDKLRERLSSDSLSDEAEKKRAYIDEMTESSDYKELKTYVPMESSFEHLFSKETLLKFDTDKLEEIKKALPVIIPTVEKTINSINCGNAWELTNEDIPDFYSYDSLMRLSNKCSTEVADKNITNISARNFLDIFSKTTVKSISSIEESFTVGDLKDINGAIRKKLSSNSFCINPSEVKFMKERIDNNMESMKEYERNIKHKKYSRFERKIIVTGVIILLLVGVNSFGMISPSGMGISTIVSVIVTMIYWIKG